jgi:hypothetical protein
VTHNNQVLAADARGTQYTHADHISHMIHTTRVRQVLAAEDERQYIAEKSEEHVFELLHYMAPERYVHTHTHSHAQEHTRAPRTHAQAAVRSPNASTLAAAFRHVGCWYVMLRVCFENFSFSLNIFVILCSSLAVLLFFLVLMYFFPLPTFRCNALRHATRSPPLPHRCSIRLPPAQENPYDGAKLELCAARVGLGPKPHSLFAETKFVFCSCVLLSAN